MYLSKEKLIQIFESRLGIPDSIQHLHKYIDFLLSYRITNTESYCEKHHILPSATFNEYSKCDWNILNLEYKDHILAHELLFKAYNIRKNQRPLQFMRSQTSKDSKLISNAARKGWINLKNDYDTYKKWRKAKSDHMKSLSSDEQSRRSKKGWDTLTKTEYEKRCKINKDNWTEERKLNKSKQMFEYFKNNPDEISARNKKRWDNINDEDLRAFKDKMNVINKDPQKRKRAGNTIKNKWKDPIFKEKMKHRKVRVDIYEAISPVGEMIRCEGMIAMINEFEFSPYLVRKFKNTGNAVTSTNTKNQYVLNTIGWKFKKIN